MSSPLSLPPIWGLSRALALCASQGLACGARASIPDWPRPRVAWRPINLPCLLLRPARSLAASPRVVLGSEVGRAGELGFHPCPGVPPHVPTRSSGDTLQSNSFSPHAVFSLFSARFRAERRSFMVPVAFWLGALFPADCTVFHSCLRSSSSLGCLERRFDELPW